MSAVRECPDHGYFAGEACPVCEESGTYVLSGDERETLSRFFSYALRHDPDDAGIPVTERGWTNTADLADAAAEEYGGISTNHVEAVVATDPKGRFEIDDGRIRAVYGHSIDVTLDSSEDPVPDTLYHGTAPENVERILADGLRPMDRQRVHLTDTVEEARAVGRRHADDPAILCIAASDLREAGQEIEKRGTAVYTTDRVPPSFVSRCDDADGKSE